MAAVPVDELTIGVPGLYEASQGDGSQEKIPVTVTAVDAKTGLCSIRIGHTDRVHEGLPVERLRRRRELGDDDGVSSQSEDSVEEKVVKTVRVSNVSPLIQPAPSPHAVPPVPIHKVDGKKTSFKAGQQRAAKRDRAATHRDPKTDGKEKARGRLSTSQHGRSRQSVSDMRLFMPPRQASPTRFASPSGKTHSRSPLENEGRVQVREKVREDYTAEEIVRLWRRLPHDQKRQAGEEIAKEYQDEQANVLRVTKTPDERLGVTCQLDNMQLLKVRPDSAADQAGASSFIGRSLTHANGVLCQTLEQLISIAKGKTEVYLRFAPQSTEVLNALVTPRVPDLQPNIKRQPSGLCPLGLSRHIVRHYGISPKDLTVGHTLLGSGSFGEAYEGNYQELRVAVKVARDVAHSESELTEWKKEVKVMTRLRHPNVLMLIGACFDPKELMIVTELCNRGTLRDVIWTKSEVSRQWNEKLDWCWQITLGMAFLHHKGIWHRDLKPSNIFVSGKTLKVADFGLSKLKAAMSRPTPSHRPIDAMSMTQRSRASGMGFEGWQDSFAMNQFDFTERDRPVRDPASGVRTDPEADPRAAEIPGTFAFIAPEVWAEQHFTWAADVYSFGITIMEIVARVVHCTGSRTSGGRKTHADWKIMTGRLRPKIPERVGGVDLPPELVELGTDATAFVPEERPTFVEAARRLHDLLSMCLDATGRDRFGDAPWPHPDEVLELSYTCDPHPSRSGEFW